MAGFTMPAFAREPRVVSLRHAAEYPFNDGRIVSSDGIDLAPSAWRDAFEEFQVEGSNALHARSLDGKGAYLVGPGGPRHARRRPAPPAREGGAGCLRATRS